MTLYGHGAQVPHDVAFEMVPIPATEDPNGPYFHYRGWLMLYGYRIGLADEADIREQVSRGAVCG